MSRFSAFISELQRRRVFRVAAVYGGVAFVLVQIIDGTFEVMGIPAWVSRLAILLLTLGFPLAVALAWVFDITPEGIVRTDRVSTDSVRKEKVQPSSGRPLTSNRALIVVALVAVAFGVWSFLREPAGALPDKSIAVRPFVNYSEAQNNEWFTDGVTEEIISQLAKISDLTVISSTSSMLYKGTGKSGKEIGDELGVAHLLEGNVRRAGDRVRIAAQLIDVRTDAHLWSAEYDRVIEDIFAIQTDVAQHIAQALQARLLPAEKQRIEHQPTQNMAAYDLYLQADDYRHEGGHANGLKAVELYEQAIGLDPTFATAHARLSQTYASLHFWHEYKDPERARQAKQAVERALQLAPELPEAHLAMGHYYNWVRQEYDQALDQFAQAQEGLTNNSELLSHISLVQMRQGHWDQALSNRRKAVMIDPRSPARNRELANIYEYLRNYPEAERYINRVIALAPDEPGGYVYKAQLYLLWEGRIEMARQVIKDAADYIDPVQVMVRGHQKINAQLGWWRFGLLDGEYEELVRIFPKTHSGGRNASYYFSMAQLYDLTNQPDFSRAYYDSARVFAENKLAANPQSTSLQADLGLACAFLGRREQAIRAGKEAVALLPISACHW